MLLRHNIIWIITPPQNQHIDMQIAIPKAGFTSWVEKKVEIHIYPKYLDTSQWSIQWVVYSSSSQVWRQRVWCSRWVVDLLTAVLGLTCGKINKYVWIDLFNVIDNCDDIDSRCYDWQLCCDHQFAFNMILLWRVRGVKWTSVFCRNCVVIELENCAVIELNYRSRLWFYWELCCCDWHMWCE